MLDMKTSSDGLNDVDENSQLGRDFLCEIVRQLSKNSLPSLLRFRAINELCENIGNRAVVNTSNRTVDASSVFSNKNPLIFKSGDDEYGANLLHDDVRRLLKQLEKIGKSYEDGSLDLVNLRVSQMRWTKVQNEEVRRCPAILQKRIKKLFRDYYQRTTKFVYEDCLLRPSRFLSIIGKQSSHITYLDLGNIKNTDKLCMHDNFFPFLPNLTTLTWSRAESKFAQALPNPHKLTHASITFRLGHLLVQHLGPILNCQGLVHLYMGLHVPKYATRFDMEVLLNSYQLFWNRRNYSPSNMYKISGFEAVKVPSSSSDGKDFCFRAFPKLERIGFWNSPANLFQVMVKNEVSFHTLQWGELNQDLNKLCSIDSVIESLFTYEAVQSYDYHFADHAKLYLHSMPVVSLDYYLPQLMALLGKVMNDVETLEIFIKSSMDSAMPSGWLLSDKRPRKCSSIFTKMTRFAFHIDNMCMLINLDILLPPTLISITLSFIITESSKKEFLDSLLCFIDKLDDTNRFPDLEEFHIQIYGITTFEVVLDHVIEVIPDLKKLSILCLPMSDDNTVIIDILKRTLKTCKNLKSLSLCPSLINRITGLGESQPEDFFKWKNKLHNFYSENDLVLDSLSIEIGNLPVCSGFDNYKVPPVFYEDGSSELLSQYDKSKREVHEPNDDELGSSDEDEDDSFIIDDFEVESEEDELDVLEKKLESENNRFYKRDAGSRKRVVSERESTDEDDVIVFKAKRRKVCEDDEDHIESSSGEHSSDEYDTESNISLDKKCSFLDDEAVEDDEEESGNETEEEPFLEEIESEAEDYVRHAVEIQSTRIRSQITRKRKIINSDSE